MKPPPFKEWPPAPKPDPPDRLLLALAVVMFALAAWAVAEVAQRWEPVDAPTELRRD